MSKTAFSQKKKMVMMMKMNRAKNQTMVEMTEKYFTGEKISTGLH